MLMCKRIPAHSYFCRALNSIKTKKNLENFEHEYKRTSARTRTTCQNRCQTGGQKYMRGNINSGFGKTEIDSQRGSVIRRHKNGNVRGEGGGTTNNNKFHCTCNIIITLTDQISDESFLNDMYIHIHTCTTYVNVMTCSSVPQ
jgi:hypothetical protein